VTQITKIQRLEERSADQLLEKALRLERALKEFKDFAEKTVNKVMAAKIDQQEIGEISSSFEFSNFDQSVLVKNDMSVTYKFDEELLQEAKNCLEEFLAVRISSEPVKEIVRQVLKLDGTPSTSIVNVLDSLREIVHDDLFIKGLDLLKAAIQQKSSKGYIRIYTREEDGTLRMISTSLSKV
jgi:hypothetical protein